MRPPPVVIHVRREEDLRCINDALAGYPIQIHSHPDGWDLRVTIRSRSLGDVLAALHQCLVEQEIPLVRLTVEGRTYAMEPAARQGST